MKWWWKMGYMHVKNVQFMLLLFHITFWREMVMENRLYAYQKCSILGCCFFKSHSDCLEFSKFLWEFKILKRFYANPIKNWISGYSLIANNISNNDGPYSRKWTNFNPGLQSMPQYLNDCTLSVQRLQRVLAQQKIRNCGMDCKSDFVYIDHMPQVRIRE